MWQSISGHASFARLKAARDKYKAFFGSDLPGTRYDFYDPPIPVEVEGSLFFDMSHVTGTRPGPASLRSRIPTIWEVHPVTDIVFDGKCEGAFAAAMPRGIFATTSARWTLRRQVFAGAWTVETDEVFVVGSPVGEKCDVSWAARAK